MSLLSSVMGTSRTVSSASARHCSTTRSTSWPSAKQWAVTSKRSPATRLTAKRPPSTAGSTASITARTPPSEGMRSNDNAVTGGKGAGAVVTGSTGVEAASGAVGSAPGVSSSCRPSATRGGAVTSAALVFLALAGRGDFGAAAAVASVGISSTIGAAVASEVFDALGAFRAAAVFRGLGLVGSDLGMAASCFRGTSRA
jgi:hypothetical protein